MLNVCQLSNKSPNFPTRTLSAETAQTKQILSRNDFKMADYLYLPNFHLTLTKNTHDISLLCFTIVHLRDNHFRTINKKMAAPKLEFEKYGCNSGILVMMSVKLQILTNLTWFLQKG